MTDLTKYYIDLSKCSESEIKELEKRTSRKFYYIGLAPFLHLLGKHWNQCMRESHSIKHKQELTYPEFIKLFEDGDGENNGWIKIESEADLPKISGDYFLFLKEGIYIQMDYWDVHRQNFKKNDRTLVSHYSTTFPTEPPKF